MLKYIDDFLNQITMYRLVLFVLIFFLLSALGFSSFGWLPINPVELIFSAVFLIAVCWGANTVFAKIFKATTNLESVYITALILTLIINPIENINDIYFFTLVAVLAMGSKYILAINRKHIFNPAAFAVVVIAFVSDQSASWWIGSFWMIPVVLLGGLLVVRKVRRFSLVLSFLLTSLVVILGRNSFNSSASLILFFSFIMLTEPQTTPPTKILQILNGFIVGLLFTPQIHLGSIYPTPELAILIGNIFSFFVSPKERLLLKLKEKIKIAPGIYDFVFGLEKPPSYLAGQYMEWTLPQKNPDSRGSRRYFTLASSPTEDNLRIGIKLYPNPSSFKKSLMDLPKDSEIIASQLSGEFTLPKDLSRKLCFIAGGIGVTPFRSMVKYLLDKNEKRDIVLLFSNKTAEDIVYQDIFDQAALKLGIKTIYVNTDTTGYIDEEMIRQQVLDFRERIFYISGRRSMIEAFEKTLESLGVKEIKVDFFPGYV